MSRISYLEPKRLTTDGYTKEENNIAKSIWKERFPRRGVIRLSCDILGNEKVHFLQNRL
jgi:hypothetical protein